LATRHLQLFAFVALTPSTKLPILLFLKEVPKLAAISVRLLLDFFEVIVFVSLLT
jgi:hypothetical protein